jgi:hypothetical protein
MYDPPSATASSSPLGGLPRSHAASNTDVLKGGEARPWPPWPALMSAQASPKSAARRLRLTAEAHAASPLSADAAAACSGPGLGLRLAGELSGGDGEGWAGRDGEDASAAPSRPNQLRRAGVGGDCRAGSAAAAAAAAVAVEPSPLYGVDPSASAALRQSASGMSPHPPSETNAPSGGRGEPPSLRGVLGVAKGEKPSDGLARYAERWL